MTEAAQGEPGALPRRGMRSSGDAAGQPKPSEALRYRLKSGSEIVPSETVSSQALSAVIAIMAFLACLAVGAAAVVAGTARGWQDDLAREVTIQIRPFDKAEMEDTIRAASRVVLGFEGIARVTAMDDASAERLLEPWLGTDLDLSELPVPRLLSVAVKPGSRPDFEAIRKALAQKVPGASLDDHRAWVGRLSRMAWTTVGFVVGILSLILCATVFTVVFATRGAMAGSRDIIEVLHFVGAEPRYIAGQFERHFLRIGVRGAIAGGLMAILVFVGLGVWTSWSRATPEGDQIAAMFGAFVLGWAGYGGILVVAAAVAALAAVTSRLTVLAQIGELEVYWRRRKRQQRA